jgi:F0F1-type ATP synthase membrane subunit c/vacuolar-type H+-ATPase subunit K
VSLAETNRIFTFLRHGPVMRSLLFLICLIPLAGCGLGTGADMGIAAGATVLSVATIHRTIPDAIVSMVIGRDCSVVRLDDGKSYCRPKPPLPPPLPYCTQTLGQATCWADPAQLPDHAPQVAEGPYNLSPAQIANHDRGWP